MAIQVGQIIEDYELVEELGSGGNGVVFKARSLTNRSEIAIKFPWKNGVQQGNFVVENFLRETSAITRLQHPNIARSFKVGVHKFNTGKVTHDLPFLMMELVHGLTASSLRSKSVKKIVSVVRKVAEAVGHAHSKRVIHCDLKPANIIIDPSGNPKVLDFGLARMLDQISSSSGVFEGTPAYAAPEQFEGKADERTDIWSLGAILFELLSGQPPFITENWGQLSQVQKIFAVQSKAGSKKLLQRMHKMNPQVDPGLSKICTKALAKDPLERYQSTEDLIFELKKWMRSHRDYWVKKAATKTKLCKFLPKNFRKKLLPKAFNYIETALSYDTATSPLKETLLQILNYQGLTNVNVVEITKVSHPHLPDWQQLRQVLQTISQLDNDYLLPIVKVVAGLTSSEDTPEQILLVYPVPLGKSWREQLGTIQAEEATELVEVLANLEEIIEDLKPGIPELPEIFTPPLQVLAIGWPFRPQKPLNAFHLAHLLYQAFTGIPYENGTKIEVSKLPQRLRSTILSVLQGNDAIKTAKDFMLALEHHREAYKILNSGILDRPFTFPPGNYHLRKTLRITQTGHLKIQGTTSFIIAPKIGIECSGRVTVKGIWDSNTLEGSVRFLPEDAQAGWQGIHFMPDVLPDKVQQFTGCVFENGYGSIDTQGKICGGAINIDSGAVKIIGACFKNNKVKGNGGAIYLASPAECSLELSHTFFIENFAGVDGGAIAIKGYGRQNFHDCQFKHNRAGENGGAIAVRGLSATQCAEVVLQDCFFLKNRAQSGGAINAEFYSHINSLRCRHDRNIAEDSGGAILLIGDENKISELHLQECKFTGNRCQIRGGAISTKRYSVISCDDSRFDANISSRDSGGAVGIDGKGGNVRSQATFRNTVFTENRCQIDGGAANSNLNTVSHFENCHFDANYAQENSGGAVVVVGQSSENISEALFFQCHFNRNRCQADGGAINVNIYTKTVFNSCRFKDNSANDSGGAVEIAGTEGEMATEANFYEVNFVENRSHMNGGAVNAVDHARCSFENCKFEQNHCKKNGGAVRIKGIECDKYSESIFRNVFFNENRCINNGGAVTIGFFTRVKFKHCRFKNNSSEQKNGGALRIIGKSDTNATEVTLQQLHFIENSAFENGGGISIGSYSLILIEKSRFAQNHAANGGALHLLGKDDLLPSKITMRKVTFGENFSQIDGGAIFAAQYTQMVLNDCELANNRAEGNCGAISIVGKANAYPSKAKFNNVAFTGNNCKNDGGAITGSIHVQMVFANCRFKNNWSESSCGALGLIGSDSKNLSEATFKNVVFVNNHCMTDGGAMVLGCQSRSKFEECCWEGNYAQLKTGGAILILGGDGHFTLADFFDCVFARNHCQIDGGAINANIYTQSSFEKCRFEENIAKQKNGGAIVLLGKDGIYPTKATLRQVVFSRNRCKISGGAINANDYTRSHYIECTFEENRSTDKNGGAILVLGENGQHPTEARFQEVYFNKNYCRGSGGAVNVNVYTITSFEKCHFEMNISDENGGGIFIRGLRRLPNKSSIKNCYFIGNIAGEVGADVALKAVKGVSEHSLLQDNTIEIPEPDFQAEELE